MALDTRIAEWAHRLERAFASALLCLMGLWHACFPPSLSPGLFLSLSLSLCPPPGLFPISVGARASSRVTQRTTNVGWFPANHVRRIAATGQSAQPESAYQELGNLAGFPQLGAATSTSLTHH